MIHLLTNSVKIYREEWKVRFLYYFWRQNFFYMSKVKQRYWRKLKHRYKLTIFNELTYEEVLHFRLSPLQVLTALSTLAVVLVTLTIILISFTNLREFIPGYPSDETRRLITQNALRIDSLMDEVQKKDNFFRSIQAIITDNMDTTSRNMTPEAVENYDTIRLGMSNSESDFRTVIEERERFNLSLGNASVDENDFYHFYAPVEGVVTNRFDAATRHYGIDVVTKPNSNVFSILDGVVIFTDWTQKTGFVIQVQHAGNLVSIYKHNSVLLKKQGDFVRAGEAIAVVGNTGEETTGPHLHFELWQSGKALDPESLVKFK